MTNQGLFDLHLINLPAGVSQTLETSNWHVEFMIVSVQAGVIDLWFSANTLGQRHLRFRANEPVSPIPIALRGDKFTVCLQGSDPQNGVSSATFIFVARNRPHFNG